MSSLWFKKQSADLIATPAANYLAYFTSDGGQATLSPGTPTLIDGQLYAMDSTRAVVSMAGAYIAADAAVLASANAYADGLVIGLLDDRGNYNASGNTFPASGGSGASGAILKGDLWVISVAGTLGGHAVTAGDLLRALVDSPGSTDANWVITENNLGYVAENSANKSLSVTTDQASNTKYPSVKAVYDWAIALLALKLTANTPITGATKTKITYDANGLVVAGADATTADIADSTNKRYVTDANLTVIGNTSGTNTGDQTSVSGNAGTATALQTARTIDGQSFDGTADIAVIAPATHNAALKATPVDADEFSLIDSAAGFILKRLTWGSLKAALKSYFDSVYQPIGIPYLGAFTWASRPNVVTSSGKTFFCNDIASGVLLYSDGLRWRSPSNSSITLLQSGIATGLAPSGSIGDNGNLRLGTFPAGSLVFSATSGSGVTVTGTGTSFSSADVGRAIICDNGKSATITAYSSPTSVTATITGTLSTTSFANNAWQLTYIVPARPGFLYFPGNAIFTGSAAGLYYTEITSTGVGTIYNNVYSGGQPDRPTSLIPFVTTGPGAYTQTTGTDITVFSSTLPGGLLGKQGVMSTILLFEGNNSASNKLSRLKLASNNLYSLNQTSIIGKELFNVFRNTGTEASNEVGLSGAGSSFSQHSASASRYFIDTAIDQSIVFTVNLANANDFCYLEGITAQVQPK